MEVLHIISTKEGKGHYVFMWTCKAGKIPPIKSASTLCIAAIRIDQSFSGTRVEATFSNSLISSFSEYTLIGSTGFSVISLSPAQEQRSN